MKGTYTEGIVIDDAFQSEIIRIRGNVEAIAANNAATLKSVSGSGRFLVLTRYLVGFEAGTRLDLNDKQAVEAFARLTGEHYIALFPGPKNNRDVVLRNANHIASPTSPPEWVGYVFQK